MKKIFFELKGIVASTMQKVDDGDLDVLDGIIKINEINNELMDLQKSCKEWINSQADEVEGRIKEEPIYKGVKFQYRAGAARFSYKGIPEWENNNKALKDIESKYKAMFKAKQKGLDYANVNSDGEELPMPEIKYGTSYLIVK